MGAAGSGVAFSVPHCAGVLCVPYAVLIVDAVKCRHIHPISPGNFKKIADVLPL